MSLLTRHVLLPALAPATTVALYFTPVLWFGWGKYQAWKAERDRQEARDDDPAEAEPTTLPFPGDCSGDPTARST